MLVGETLTYNGATSNDAHVATTGKYLNAITLGNASDGSGGLASNYQLPTLNVTNAPITINPKTLTLTLTNSGYSQVYDGAAQQISHLLGASMDLSQAIQRDNCLYGSEL